MVGDIQAKVARLQCAAAGRYDIRPEQCHVGHLVLEGLLARPTALCQVDAARDTQETSISLALRSMRLASALQGAGLRPGDRVVLIARGDLHMAAVFYACHYMGYTLCSIDPELDLGDMKRLYPTLTPRVVFTIQYCAEKSAAALAHNNIAVPVVVVDDDRDDLENFITDNNGTEVNFRPAVGFDTAQTTAWLMLTSGTTGPPKPAIIPYDHVLNAVLDWWHGVPAVSANMILTSTQWLTSMVYTVSAPIKSYARIQSSLPMSPQILLHMINTYKPDVTSWTPFLLARFVQGPRDVCDLSCLKHILIGGGAVDQRIISEFRKICPARLYLAYGMSEIVTVTFRYEDETTPLGSCGKAMDKIQYRLIDENGKDLTGPHQKGELWIKGYGFFTGYLDDIEETRKVLTEDGWLKTGDIFYRDENHYYYYVERKKLLIRYLTFFISPLEIEEVIKRHPGVSDACVVGIPHPATMEMTVAAVLSKPGHQVDPQEIFDLVHGELPEKKHLRGGLFFVDSFPTTVSSKVNRNKVRDMAVTAERIMPKT